MILGVRVAPKQLEEALRTALRSHVVVGTEEVPAHYSVRLASESDQDPEKRDFHLLYDGACLEMRSLDTAAILKSVLDLLAVHQPLKGRLVEVRATALLDADDRVILLPASARRGLTKAERQLRAMGFRVVRPDLVRIDLERDELVIDPPNLDVDWTPLRRFVGPGSSDRSELVAPGRYRLRRWYLYERDHKIPGAALPQAVALGIAMRSIVRAGSTLSDGDVWRALTGVTSRVDTVAAGDGATSDLIRSLGAPGGSIGSQDEGSASD